MNNLRNILVCVAGLSPQIVSEAYYAIAIRQKIEIDELYVLTTNDCRAKIEEIVDRIISDISIKYGLKKPLFSPENIMSASSEIGYSDSTNEVNSITTTDMIFDFFLKKSIPMNRIYCCLSGGRKTMSTDAALAFTIFANKEDKLFHIVNDSKYYPNERYYPTNDIEDKNLFYIEKPVFKLRKHLDFHKFIGLMGYREIMHTTQKELDSTISFEDLVIDKKSRQIIIGNKSLNLTPLNFAVYLFFAKSKKPISGGKNFSKSNSTTLWNIYRRLSGAKGHAERVARSSIHNEIIDFDVIQKSISNIRSALKKLLDDNPLIDYYSITTSGNYADKVYEIKLPKNKISIK